jgi:putative endonuclease
MESGGYVYIVTNKNKTVLYIGVTSRLMHRIHQHKTKHFQNSFTARYNCDRLVYYEGFQSIVEAIIREKKLKGTNRKKKESLINGFNPNWVDLFDTLEID